MLAGYAYWLDSRQTGQSHDSGSSERFAEAAMNACIAIGGRVFREMNLHRADGTA